MTVQPIRCPKCKSINITLSEHILCYGEWSPGDDKAVNQEGNYFKVTGHCFKCSNNWTLRGEIQMNENLKAKLNENYRLLVLEGKVKEK